MLILMDICIYGKFDSIGRSMQTSNSYLKDSHEFGLNVEEELKAELEKLTIVYFLKTKQKKKQEKDDAQVIRYTAVKTYNVLELAANVNTDSPVKKTDLKSDEATEKQLFTPTAGKPLKEIENEQILADRSRDTTVVKRNIDFVSSVP